MILEVALMGHPVLLNKAESVKDISDTAFQTFVSLLIETHEHLDGVGLAAPQVFVPLRVIVIEVSQEKAEKIQVELIPQQVLINPVIEIVNHELELDMEACLSIPGLCGEVPRYQSLRCTSLTMTGETITQTFEGYGARIIQHESDHLDGKLYPMKMNDIKHLSFVDAISA
jgi:peptide deformylase